HPQIGKNAGVLGYQLLGWGKAKEAEPLLREYLAWAQQSPQAGVDPLRAAATLGKSLLAQKKYARIHTFKTVPDTPLLIRLEGKEILGSMFVKDGAGRFVGGADGDARESRCALVFSP